MSLISAVPMLREEGVNQMEVFSAPSRLKEKKIDPREANVRVHGEDIRLPRSRGNEPINDVDW